MNRTSSLASWSSLSSKKSRLCTDNTEYGWSEGSEPHTQEKGVSTNALGQRDGGGARSIGL